MTQEEARKFVQDLNNAIADTVYLTGELAKRIEYIESQIDFMVTALNT